MESLKQMIGWQTVTGRPVTRGDFTVTPQSQALTIRWPNGGLVWNRPVAILVERGQQTERIPIVDITRVLQWGLLGFSLVLGIITFALTVLDGRDRNG
jgi:hypothetical protein